MSIGRVVRLGLGAKPKKPAPQYPKDICVRCGSRQGVRRSKIWPSDTDAKPCDCGTLLDPKRGWLPICDECRELAKQELRGT